MAQFDPSRIVIFRAYDLSGTAPNIIATTDNNFLYAMIDAAILADSLAGLTAPQQTLVNSYKYTPLASDYSSRGFPTWAGADPAPVYFKGAEPGATTKMQSALAKYYK